MSKMADSYYDQSKKWLSGLRESLQKTNSNIDSSYDSLAQGINAKYQNNINQFQNDQDVQRANALASGRQAYRNYMNAINPFSSTQNQLARAGLGNSGYAESLGIRANNNYLTNVGNINTQRDLALANLESQITNTINTRNAELQEAETERNKALYDNFMNWLGRYEDYKKEQEAEAKAKATKSSGSGGSSRSSSATLLSENPAKESAKKKLKVNKNAKYTIGSKTKKIKRNIKEVSKPKNNPLMGIAGLRVAKNRNKKTNGGKNVSSKKRDTRFIDFK